jgi:RND superfamily putative drug exporter
MVRLRWLVVAFWAVAVGACVLLLPAIGNAGADVSELVSPDSPAVRSELQSLQKFGFPLLSRVAVVQRDPHGLPMQTQARALERARAVTRGEYPDAKPIVAAVPVPNTLAIVPGSRESSTTVITLLFTASDVTLAQQLDAARRFVADHFDASDHVIGVTGSVPARVQQGRLVNSSLPVLEVVTTAAALLIVALAFRSLVAPVVTLGVAGAAVLLTLHIGGATAARMGIVVPAETQPLLVALLLGVVTDYVIFYLSAMRVELASGAGRLEAAERATARFTPIIATAGATAAAGTGALIAARSPAFRAFGPGMALAVLIGMVVAVTLVPALLAILGSAALWPGRRAAAVEPDGPRPTLWARLLTQPVFALIVLLVCVGGLVWAAVPVRHLTLRMSLIPSLPASDPTRKAATQAETGFADGILSPTEVLLQGPGVGSRKDALSQLQESLARQPGVAGVLGPTDETLIPESLNLFHTADGSAARYLLILSDEPHGGRALHTIARLQRNLPGLLKTAGLTGVHASLGGDTAIAKDVVDQTTRDIGRIAIAALLANLLFLVLFLRALTAPLLLLGCSILAIAATLGLTTELFQVVLGGDGLTFYVPLAAAVLLVALGSDYNIFGVGHAWEEARVRPLRKALAMTIPQSARAIRTAGFTLAVTFGLLALVPLRPFRELAFALSVGILIDALIVRSLLVPALLAVVGSSSGWPGRHLFTRRVEQPQEEEVVVRQP